MKKLATILVDIDGTLADISERRKHLQKEKPDWKAFFVGVEYDAPIQPIIDLVKNIQPFYHIVLITGRDDSLRTDTIAWLKRYGIAWDYLYMRPDGDDTPDFEFKSQTIDCHLQHHKIDFAIDDRSRVVKMYRDKGIICLQCDVGDF